MNKVARIYSVSEINRLIKNTIEEELGSSIQIEGEISNLRVYSSGHYYFTLKDSMSILKCVMFKGSASRLRFVPADGMSIIALGRISVYERDGCYQLYVDALMVAGAGILMQKYEALKEKLRLEGLFDNSQKKKLPYFVKSIGVVTSPTGAVIRDIINVARKRNLATKIFLFPVRVQGKEAPQEIVQAIGDAQNFSQTVEPLDVLIIGRGGGSIEDLWSFNEEEVVRATANAKIPTISAVGHETDFTLIDFASDVRAATPSQAAEIAVRSVSELQSRISFLAKKNWQMMQGKVNYARLRWDKSSNSYLFKYPERLLQNYNQNVDALLKRFTQAEQNMLVVKKNRLVMLSGKLETLSPLAILKRGYTVSTDASGKTIKSIKSVRAGDEVVTTVKDGKIISSVTYIS